MTALASAWAGSKKSLERISQSLFPSLLAVPLQTCSGTAEVIGGQVNGVPTTPSACPAGSYDDSEVVDGCRPW
jgi:hypothetical protein